MKNKYLLVSFFISSLIVNAQQNIQKTDTLDEVIISSTRIDLPFKKNSRTIQLITAEDLKKAGVSNVADALQQIAGIDIRRRGTNGMQADLYIRGGSFDQTLLLVDGIKVDDAQTGHHTMNLALPIEVIKRIEFIKVLMEYQVIESPVVGNYRADRFADILPFAVIHLLPYILCLPAVPYLRNGIFLNVAYRYFGPCRTAGVYLSIGGEFHETERLDTDYTGFAVNLRFPL